MTAIGMRLVTALAGVVVGLLAADALAQQPAGFALNQYQPTPAGDAFFSVPAPWIGGHIIPRAMLTFDYCRDPLVVRDEAGNRLAVLVSSQGYSHLGASFALFDRLLISADFPLALVQSGEQAAIGEVTLRGSGGVQAGDLRLGLRGRLWGDYYQPLQIALGGYLFVPTAPAASYVGDGAAYVQPQLLLGGRLPYFVWSASAGAVLRTSSNPHAITFKAAAGVEVLDGALRLGPELFGSRATADPPFVEEGTLRVGRRATPNLEMLFGVQAYVLGGLSFGAAGGTGLTGGSGTPLARVLARVAWAPQPVRIEEPDDVDGDNIGDDVDACPETVGQPSADPLLHGCPPPSDLDGDGVFDEDDACPDEAGGSSDEPDQRGCPPAAPSHAR